MRIGSQRTPGHPIEITFAPETGLADDSQYLLLIGRAELGATGTETVISISNVSDADAAQTEAETKFGVGSELAKMVVAAVNANASAARSTFPPIKCVPLASTETTITSGAQTAVKSTRAEFVVSPFDGDTDTDNRNTLKEMCATMSGATRVENNQFGTIGVAANFAQTDPANLPAADSQYLSLCWFRDAAPAITLGELAAAYAATLAGNISPFYPVNNFVLGGLDAQVAYSDRISVGSGLESETALGKGWSPIKTKPNDEVAIVRSVTTRTTTNGTTAVTAYYDVQDFQVLYYWRRVLATRFSQTDITNTKASSEKAKSIKAEVIRLANLFEDNDMFQAVDTNAKNFTVERNATDRHRFDIYTPVNVIPGLHVVATTVEATTEGDVVTV